jgi:hypothetical protein
MLAALVSTPALAQPSAPVARADLSGTIGWLVTNKESPGPYNGNDWQSSLFAAASGGWYWTDHLKSELEFGAGTEATAYRYRNIVIDGRTITETGDSTYSRRTLSLSQQYQFFRNAWFHPHVAAGLNVTFERTTDYTNPIVVYDDRSRGLVLQPARTDGPRTDVVVSPFIATGFKAYVTQRGFFRSDLRVSLREGVESVMMRFGFGVDF